MRRTSFDHQFVEFIPTELEEGVLYVSVQYATAVHKCACGCGNRVVTPISPVGWQLLFDGKTVSLTPSIGNWQFPCRSHYWIKSDKVRWARAWTPEEIAAGRQSEARDYERYFASRQAASNSTKQTDAEAQAERQPRKGLLARVLQWLRHKNL
ncbi:MAG TPA: DUF6527 family protein [Ktedonobacteraceae bacterium]|nr:DUF6527 family protein [Ktedonobacteraceae bacterium]